MDSAELRIFEAVARTGSMSRAAAELHTVQSNVTARIKGLEDRLGRTLLERSPRGVRLTAAGRRLLPYAKRTALLLEDARRAARDDGDPAGPLAIGSYETGAAIRLAPMLSGFLADHPAVDLTLKTGTSAELIELVREGAVEGAFVSAPVAHPDLESEEVYEEELALFTAPGRTLEAALATPDLKIILLRAGCSYRLRLESWLARRGVVATRLMEFGTLEAILSAVSAGIGVTALPKEMATLQGAGRIAAHPLPGEDGRVACSFIRRRDAYASSALLAFLERVRRESADAEALSPKAIVAI